MTIFTFSVTLMNYSNLYESKKRGTFDFPIELYYVDSLTPRYEMPLHWHLEYELITVLRGSFELSLDGEKTVMYPGDCAFINGGVVHGGIPDGCIYECLVFDLQAFLHNMPVRSKSLAAFLSDTSGITGVYKSGSVTAQTVDKIFDSMECERRGYELVTVGLMWQLLGEFASSSAQNVSGTKSTDQISRLKNVLSFIHKNIDHHISLDELAETAGMSPKYFCRVFKDLTGKRPIEYLNYYRIESACEMLTLTDESVTEIAMNCGFDDMSYFSKTFARYKGLSPNKFRKQNN